MSTSTIRVGIKSALEAVSGIENVHDYTRRVNSWAEIESEFEGATTVHAWVFKYSGSVYSWDTTFEGKIADRRFDIWGLYAINDTNASEKDFDDIIEAVELAFANDRIFTNGLTKINSLSVDIDEQMFAGILCHRAIVTLGVQERISYV